MMTEGNLMTERTYNFRYNPVPAHRHTNPDGSTGELAERIAPGGAHGWPKATEGRWRADYEAVIALARARQAEWAAA